MRLEKKYKERVTSWLKILIAIGLLIYLVSAVSFREIVSALHGANYFMIALASVMSFLNIYLQFLKWKILCREVVEEKENKAVLYSLFYGFSAGIITPFRLGEYVGRALAFKGNKALKVTLATLIDKFFAFVPVFFIGAIASAVFLYIFYGIGSVWFSVLIVVILISSFFYLYSVLKTDFWERQIIKLTSKSSRLAEYTDGLRSFKLLSGKTSLEVSLNTFLTYLTYIAQYGFLVAAFSNGWDIIVYSWLGMLIFFAKAVIPPVTFGELGIRESASVFFAVKLGLTSAVGFNAAIFLFFINVLLPSIPGAALLLRSKAPGKKEPKDNPPALDETVKNEAGD
ncbi:MAG TPA: lysylphosphatidylglycerol synthase transmembrane domain-containing protein [Ignavibacteriales bacterium]|nr:lysylphosphatidylglycerol synthase transmembrane domain-containing protein [Ignavibacteriales bacterium]